MKKIALVVLVYLAMGMLLGGCSKNNTSKLQEWQEAEIAGDVIPAMERNFVKKKIKVISRDDVEIYYHFSATLLDGSKALHWYFGWLPVNTGSSEKKVNIFFVALFSESLMDVPNPMSTSGEMIKKGKIEKIKVTFLEAPLIDTKGLTEQKMGWVNALRESLKKEWGDRLKEELL